MRQRELKDKVGLPTRGLVSCTNDKAQGTPTALLSLPPPPPPHTPLSHSLTHSFSVPLSRFFQRES